MKSKLSDEDRVKFAHWSAYNKFDEFFKVLKVDEIIESLNFFEINKLRLRKSILKLNTWLRCFVAYKLYNFQELLVLFDEFERWCRPTDSYTGKDYFFQSIRRQIYFQICSSILWEHMGFSNEDLHLLAPTETFCSKCVYAQNYLVEIDSVFEQRRCNERDLDEQASFEEMRASDLDSDFKSLTSDLISADTDPLLLNPIKVLNLLYSHDPNFFFVSFSALVEQFEKDELSTPVIKLRGFAQNSTCSVASNLFGTDGEERGYNSGEDRVFRSWTSPMKTKKMKILSPALAKKEENACRGKRYDYNKKGESRQRKDWTFEETKTLLSGLEKHGKKYVQIIDDPEFFEQLNERDNVQVKDKVRLMVRNGEISFENVQSN